MSNLCPIFVPQVSSSYVQTAHQIDQKLVRKEVYGATLLKND